MKRHHFRRASATRRGSLLGILALAVLALIASLALAAAPASAADPTPETLPATEVSYDSAVVHGKFDPGDLPFAYWFQYTTDPTSGLWFYGPGYIGPFVPPGSGMTEVGEKLFGEYEFGDLPFGIALEGNTTYYYRLAITRAECCYNGFYSSPPYASFTTLPVEKATVPSAGVSNITNRTAEVAGVISRPANLDPAFNAHCNFEYLTDAAYAPRSAKQRLTIKAEGGTYTLSFSNKIGYTPQTTVPIAYNAPKATVQAALEGISNIGPGGVTVTGGPGSASGSFPYTINFTGPLANKNVLGIGVDGTGLPEGSEAYVAGVISGHPEGFEGATQLPCKPDPIADPGTHPVTGELTGLAPNTTYHLQLTAKNAGGKNHNVVGTFTTTAEPVVKTLPAATIHDTSAVLGGRVNPENAPITYQFEWGAGTTYGNLLPAAPEVLLAEDESPHVVTKPLPGLVPETTYHYRIAATNTITDQTIYGADKSFRTLGTPGAPQACPNEDSRIGLSAYLPDCRLLEFATPDLNFAFILGVLSISPDGSGFVFGSNESPLDSESNEALFSVGTSKRDASGKWKTRGINPGAPAQISTYGNLGYTSVISEDLTEWASASQQPLAGPGSPKGGINYFFHKADGTWLPMTSVAAGSYAAGGGCCLASRDFKHIFFFSGTKQDPSEVTTAQYLYEFVDGVRRPVGILPGETTPAPAGAFIPYQQNGKGSAISGDGKYVLFKVFGDPNLYMRVDGKETINVSASQRTVDPDPNPVTDVRMMGMSDDGSTVLFTSNSELTNDANTGEAEGVANDSGFDMYSYDVQSGKLTDLTVATKPEDKAHGADIVWVIGRTLNFDFVYFVARGNLAPGGVTGVDNLYVWHDGEIDFVAANPSGYPESGYPFGEAPDGRHVVFASSDTLTAYDNKNPTTGEPMQMVYKYTYKGSVECVSCRPSGERPTTGAGIGIRPVSADGSHVFFETGDAILPTADNGGLGDVFSYVGGEVHQISPPSGTTNVRLMGASVSGDDLFIETIGELVPHGEGDVIGIYDARVGGVAPPPPPPVCQGEGCRSAPTTPPDPPTPGTSNFSASVRVSVSESRGSRGKTAQLRVIVPEGGDLTISGKGLKTLKSKVSKAGSVSVTLTLTSGKNKRRLRKGVFNTRAEVLFTSSSGETSRDEVALKFEASKRKGGK